MGVSLGTIAVDVTVTLEGSPLLATQATMRVAVKAADKTADVESVLRRAREISAVTNSIERGFPIRIVEDC